MTTPTTETFANPDGSYTDEIAVEPVRVNREGSWLAIDTTLQPNADGSLSPKVSPLDLRFSGGGSQALATMSRGGVTVDLTWPTALPQPTLAGNTAIYADVYPDVDLEVSAVGSSLTHRLIIKSRAAAADPRVRSVTYGQTVRGGRKAIKANGAVTVTDGYGKTMFELSQPIMWDSSSTSTAAGSAPLAPSSSKSTARSSISAADSGAADIGSGSVGDSGGTSDDPVEGDKVAALPVTVTADSMTVAPPASVLDSAATTYPVILDPPGGPGAGWAMVDAAYPGVSYYKYLSDDQGVGYQDFSAWSRKRLFFGFTTSGYIGTYVKSAKFSAYEVYSATCGAGTVDAYLTNPVSSATTWNNQPSRIGGIRSSFSIKAGRSDCNPGGYTGTWDVTTALKDRMAAKSSTTTIQLAGRDESTTASWMRFKGVNVAADWPRLVVDYTHIPAKVSTNDMRTPTGGTACATSKSNATPMRVKLPNSTSTVAYLYAAGKDGDSGNIRLEFYLASNSITTGAIAVSANVLSPQGSVAVPTNLTEGGDYAWKVRALDDDGGVGAWSDFCWFRVDNVNPTPPAISVVGGTAQVLSKDATSVTLSFARPDAKFFDWKLGTTQRAQLTAISGTASTTLSLAGITVASIVGQTVDTANNVSGYGPPLWLVRATPQRLAAYGFNSLTKPGTVTASTYHATPGAQAQWDIDIDPDLVPWTEGRYATCESTTHSSGNPVSPCGSTNWAISFPDGSTPVVDDHRPVRTDDSFTVGTWVHIDEDAGLQTILAQDGTDGYRLEYVPDYKDATMSTPQPRFVFTVGTGTGAVRVADPLPAAEARTSRWIYIAGVYNDVPPDTTNKASVRMTAVTKSNLGNNDYGQGNTDISATSTPVKMTRNLAYAAGSFRIGDSAVSTPLRGAIDNLSFYQAAMDQQALIDAAIEDTPGNGN